MKNNNSNIDDSRSSNTTQIATLANGCFWCSEAIFKRLKGVKSVLPGFQEE
jgi:peptide-methionine (S)-S-oxide reductase